MEIRLEEIVPSGVHSVVALRKDKNPNIIEEIHVLEKKTRRKIVAALDMIAKNGIQNVSRSRYKQFKGESGLYEILARPYRILFFTDGRRLIICTHYFRKKTNKTPKGEIDRLRKERDRYFALKDLGIEFEIKHFEET